MAPPAHALQPLPSRPPQQPPHPTPVVHAQVKAQEVVQLLEKTLGRPPKQPLLRHHYEWIDALAMAGRPVSRK